MGPCPPPQKKSGEKSVARMMYSVTPPCPGLMVSCWPSSLTVIPSLEVKLHPPRLPPSNVKWAQPLKWAARVETSHSSPESHTSTKQLCPASVALNPRGEEHKDQKGKKAPTQHTPEGHSPHMPRAHPSPSQRSPGGFSKH